MMQSTAMTEREVAEHTKVDFTITVGDLFCGMGGWSSGFRMYNAGMDGPFKMRWALDNWDRACGVHMHNHPTVPVECSDIRDVDPYSFEKVDVIVGSPPCPPFSSAKQWQKKDIRKGFELVEAFFKFIDILKPKVFVMENVVPFRRFIERKYIRNLPSEYKSFIMNGVDFGLPQRRRRCVLGNIEEPKFRSPNAFTLGEVIDWLGLPGEIPINTVMNPFHYPQMVVGSKANRHDLYEVKEEHIVKLFKKKMMKDNAGLVPFPDPLDRPARTIVAKPSPVGREPVVVLDQRFKPNNLRYLSLREQLLIQGFPADYLLSDSSKVNTQVMIGNAFPPLMVKVLAVEIWNKVRGLS